MCKSDDRNDVQTHRPISVLAYLSKVVKNTVITELDILSTRQIGVQSSISINVYSAFSSDNYSLKKLFHSNSRPKKNYRYKRLSDFVEENASLRS